MFIFYPRCNLHSDSIDKNGEQKGAKKIIGDTVNALIDNMTEEYVYSYINFLQK